MSRIKIGSLLEFLSCQSAERRFFRFFMAFIGRGSEIPFVAYFIYKDTSKIVRKTFSQWMNIQKRPAEEEGYSFVFGLQTDVCL